MPKSFEQKHKLKAVASCYHSYFNQVAWIVVPVIDVAEGAEFLIVFHKRMNVKISNC